MNPIQIAISLNCLVIVEYLLLWPFDANLTDSNGFTALHHAVDGDHVRYIYLCIVCYMYSMYLLRLVVHLLKKDAKYTIKDHLGRTPLDLAVEKALVQIVTILRLFQFDNDQRMNVNISPKSPTITNSSSISSPGLQ